MQENNNAGRWRKEIQDSKYQDGVLERHVYLTSLDSAYFSLMTTHHMVYLQPSALLAKVGNW